VGAGLAIQRAGIVAPESVVGTLVYAALAAWLLYRAPQPPYEIALAFESRRPARPTDWRLLALVLPLIATTGAALYLVTLAASFAAPERVAESLAAADTSREGDSLRALPNELIESAMGAIAEEWLFRGVLLQLWARRFGVRFAVLATSVLFAALHADVIGSLIFGVVMAALYVRTGTLLVPIMVHFLFNTVVTVGAVLFPDASAMTLAEFRQDWWMGVVGFAGGVAVVVWVVRTVAPLPWRLPDVPGAHRGS
jgi:membrane protease YdiL (CAAX protease family)